MGEERERASELDGERDWRRGPKGEGESGIKNNKQGSSWWLRLGALSYTQRMIEDQQKHRPASKHHHHHLCLDWS